MIYEIGMLWKHFKGTTLLERNIYRIIKLNVNGIDIDNNNVTYTGEGKLEETTDLVVYQNIFQENKYFAREYSDISSELSIDKQNTFNQTIKVQPLTQEEIELVTSEIFTLEKASIEQSKHSKRLVKE